MQSVVNACASVPSAVTSFVTSVRRLDLKSHSPSMFEAFDQRSGTWLAMPPT